METSMVRRCRRGYEARQEIARKYGLSATYDGWVSLLWWLVVAVA